VSSSPVISNLKIHPSSSKEIHLQNSNNSETPDNKSSKNLLNDDEEDISILSEVIINDKNVNDKNVNDKNVDINSKYSKS